MWREIVSTTASVTSLDGKWQGLEKIRILMGAETTHRTRKVLTRAVEILDGSIESNKDRNPFLNGVPAIEKALRSGQIECRVYDRDKFHAKAYITHAKKEMEVVGSQALVGSSNFTAPGLTKNIELNIQVQSAREVAQLQEWFEEHWNEAREVTDAVVETISRHTHLYTPLLVCKMLSIQGLPVRTDSSESLSGAVLHGCYPCAAQILQRAGRLFLCVIVEKRSS